MTASKFPSSQRKLSLLALALLGAVSSSAVFAQDAPGWYVGGNIGATQSDFNNDSINSTLAGRGFRVNAMTEDDSSSGYKLFGGYQLNRNFAVEGGYYDLGRFSYNSTTTPPGSFGGSTRVKGLNLDLVGTLPLTDRFSVIGRVGAAYARSRASVATTGFVPFNLFETSKNDTYAKVGLGLQYALTEALAVRAELERYRVHDPVRNRGYIDMASVGLIYRFGAKAPTPVAYTPAYVAPPPPPPPPPPVVVAPPPPPRPVVVAPPPPPPPPAPPAYEPPVRPAKQGRN